MVVSILLDPLDLESKHVECKCGFCLELRLVDDVCKFAIDEDLSIDQLRLSDNCVNRNLFKIGSSVYTLHGPALLK